MDEEQGLLNYSFKASVPGMDDLEGTQVIGWDPAAGTIRSWMFDSDGGFGEGTWSKKGNTWIVKFHQISARRPQGVGHEHLHADRRETFTWKSIGREVDGEFLPNVEEVKMVRRTASDLTQGSGKAGEQSRKQGAKN